MTAVGRKQALNWVPNEGARYMEVTVPLQKIGDDYLLSFVCLKTGLASHEAKETSRTRVLKVLDDR
ncbi:hypothetical protein [Roseibium sp.]|uniref:hypothetical protein n=1 Tax=Roseibium sp. TaxID=1936156 RepID=UPI003D0E6535